jgi:mannose-6-phosphate isomerase-like protein (cupin superfamily)
MAFALGLLGIAAELQWMHALGFYWQATTRSYALVAGSYVAIPRNTSHGIVRRGNRPLILLSVLSGEPCEQAK